MDKKEIVVWKSGRIFLGIISILFSLLIISSANSTYIISELSEEAIELKETGIFTGIFMLLGGICGLCNCGNNKKSGFVITTILFAIPYLINDGHVWYLFSMIFGLFYIICGIVAKKQYEKPIKNVYVSKPKSSFPKYDNRIE